MTDRYTQGPVASGDVYCSPWCGFKCTKAAFDRATLEAAELAARMGPGWEPIVWENGGWHYRVRKGCATINVRTCGGALTGTWKVTGYSGWIEPKISIGDDRARTMVQFIENAETPEDALGFATQAARTHMIRLTEALADILETPGPGAAFFADDRGPIANVGRNSIPKSHRGEGQNFVD